MLEQKSKDELLSPSEAVYGFAAWLSTRAEVLRIGSAEGCASLADLCRDFCAANGFPDPRPQWHNKLTHPKEGE